MPAGSMRHVGIEEAPREVVLVAVTVQHNSRPRGGSGPAAPRARATESIASGLIASAYDQRVAVWIPAAAIRSTGR